MIKKLVSFLFIDGSLKKDIEFLQKISLFKGLSHRALAKIALLGFKKNYLPQEQIFTKNKEAEVLYLILNGNIAINKAGKETLLTPCDIFGEISLIKDKKHNYDAKSIGHSELYLICRVKLEDMFSSDYKSGYTVIKNLLNTIGANKI
jgi:CRP-like cAMP-binding protein